MFNLLLSVATVWKELYCWGFGGTCCLHVQDRSEYDDEVDPGVQLHIYLTLLASEMNMEKACSSEPLAKVSRPKNRINMKSAIMKAFKFYAQFQQKWAKLQSSKLTVKRHTLWCFNPSFSNKPIFSLILRCVIPVVLSNNKNKLLVHMYVVKNTTIFLILRLL